MDAVSGFRKMPKEAAVIEAGSGRNPTFGNFAALLTLLNMGRQPPANAGKFQATSATSPRAPAFVKPLARFPICCTILENGRAFFVR
ncbi:hypothetical protein GCN74_25160 [Janthinobacterium sp. FT14W]|uniref:hypothetical protein n=1 Tax=Janthinobacterium sp. FT14W TaxID=2654253 RepID=UPI001263F2DB|nr:hypothetical protein [Janthinobacterium sp. FT14W]KAB8053552.1 hypothetical protein GCN74_25160 [Janthinobacterium sp. FT14W]